MSDDQVRGAILAILGPDPTPSILFGAPSVSLQQLEKTLQLDAHTLDPTRIVPVASGVGRELGVPHEAEHRQLKRGKVFEDWLVFRRDESVVGIGQAGMGPIHPGSVGSTAHSDSPPVPNPHPSERARIPPGLSGGHVGQEEGRAPPLSNPSSRDKVTPPPQTFESATTASQPTQERRFGLRFLGRKKDISTQPLQQTGQADQAIWKQPPHRINSQLITTLPLLPELTSAPPPPPPPPPAPAHPPSSPARPSVHANQVVEPAPLSTTAVDQSHPLSRDVPKLVLPTLADIKKKRKADEERVETRPMQEERLGTGHPVVPESLPHQVEDDEQDSKWAESPRSSQEEIDRFEDPPATSSSVYSAASNSTTLSDYPETPSSAASAHSFLSDTPLLSVPPSPWLNKAFHDLPFGPNVPALQLAEWLQARWQILVAQLVAVGAAVYVLQATGL